LVQRWSASMQDNYGTPPVALVRGSGARVWDEQGREYVDLLAGIATNSLGHAHPHLVRRVSEQVATLGHVSNLAVAPPGVELAERLRGLLGADARIFFCNSGAEANEAAFKLSRLTGRTRVVVAESSFHGRTMGALALTAQPAKQDPFRPLPGDVVAVPFGDAAALREAITPGTAAVFLEPIQGEGGVIVPPPGYLEVARTACDEVGALLILDEVQCGMGRTGAWFAHEADGIRPDVVTLAKGLGGGLPIGAMVALGPAGELFTPGSHGSTFGGSPVSCAAALAVLDVLEAPGALDHVRVSGERLAGAVASWDLPIVDHVRGRGLLRAIALRAPVAKHAEAAIRDRGSLVNAVSADALRLAPPLTITDAELADGLAAVHAGLVDVMAMGE
jgi:acetylornithine/N-succinyldiaminopimelate aminotransferase